MGQLSLCAITTEPACPIAHALQQEKPLQWEACAPQLESSLCSPQLEEVQVHQWSPCIVKENLQIQTTVLHMFASASFLLSL